MCSGHGVFAEREFAEDELILVYGGETCSAERGRVSQHVAKLCGGYVDVYASVGGMLNTSASPNAFVKCLMDADDKPSVVDGCRADASHCRSVASTGT